MRRTLSPSLVHAVYNTPIFRFGLAKTGWHQHLVVRDRSRHALSQRCLKVRRWPQAGGRGYAKHSEVRFILYNVTMTAHKATAETMTYWWKAIAHYVARFSTGEMMLCNVRAGYVSD